MDIRSNGQFSIIEHTADVGLEVTAPSLAELYRQAALGMISLMVDPETVEPDKPVPVMIAGADREEVLVSWLTEILYQFESYRMLFSQVAVDCAGNRSLKATLRGEQWQPRKHDILKEIKAVTYHALNITEGEGPHGVWSVRIIFDI